MPTRYDASGLESLQRRFPQRATSWQLRETRFRFSNRPLLMGIVNVTPDSFSDGGSFFSTTRAVEHALELVEQGADLLDVGGESTRPYATPVDEAEELRRIVPVIERVGQATKVPISVDTSKARVAQCGLEAGAQVINDVTGLSGDPRMIEVALGLQPGLCVMHMQGTPRTMQDEPRYRDVVADISRYLRERRDALLTAGIAQDRLCLDPGIGFGKTHQHNLTLMAHCDELHEWGCPLLIGHSRKGFLAKFLSDAEADRTAATVGASLALAQRGIQVLRVHDVRPIREALQLFAACGGIDGCAEQLVDRATEATDLDGEG